MDILKLDPTEQPGLKLQTVALQRWATEHSHVAKLPMYEAEW